MKQYFFLCRVSKFFQIKLDFEKREKKYCLLLRYKHLLDFIKLLTNQIKHLSLISVLQK